MFGIPFFTLARRESSRFLMYFNQTVTPPVMSTLLYILVFGYSLGNRIADIHGFDYITYILPGLAQLGVIQHAYQNTSTSLFMARLDRSLEIMLTTPLHYLEMVCALLVGSWLRGLTVGFATLIVSAFFVDFNFPHLGWLFLSWSFTAVLFGAVGIIAAIVSHSWDHVACIGNYVLMPLTFLGGTFYNRDSLPPFWQKMTLFNPVYYVIDSTRYAILGFSEIVWLKSFALTFGLCVFLVGVATALFYRGIEPVK